MLKKFINENIKLLSIKQKSSFNFCTLNLLNGMKRGKNRQIYKIEVNDKLYNFKVQNIIKFDEFQMNAFILEHENTGAKYFHLDSSDLNNTFAIHFNTPAFDNTGVFHILEHLSLCGSKKYPVRDPFMNMMKRSLNSYMNAWTGNDFTMFPFAAQNEKDFRNLRDVYLDATYFPKLDYFDFLQEGWRYEFLEPSNRNSGLIFKGVVLNEMKGDMCKQDSYMIQKIQSHLFENSPYNFNSGGDPKFIPSLNYDDLVATHKKYYHPSNSKYFSYGDMNFLENLEFLDENLLSKYTKGNRFIVAKSKNFSQPKEVIEYYQPELGLGTESANQAKIAVSYLCMDINENPYETFKLSILVHLLIEGPSSVMYKKLIESGLAPGYSHGTGIDTSNRECIVSFGVQNIENDFKKFKEIENVIIEGLNDIAQNGFKQNLIEEVLHLIEYDSKRTRDDFGINFLSQSSGFLTHSDYPFSMLHVNEYTNKLKKELRENSQLFQKMIKSKFLLNAHRLTLILRPKEELISLQNKEENDRLNNIDQNLSQEEAKIILENTKNLVNHQSQIQDMNILPCLNLEDIPRMVESVNHEKSFLMKNIPFFYFDQPTNGISYIRIKANLKNIPAELKNYIPLYNLLLPRLGTKNYSYEEFQNKLHTISPGLSVSIDAFTDYNNTNVEYENLVYEFSFLDSNISKALNLYSELFSVPNFFDLTYLNQIIKEESVKIANEIVNNSLDYAISYAKSGFKSYNKTYESFKSDMFICKLGADLLQCASPRDILQGTSEQLYLLHNLIFRRDSLQLSLHGQKKFCESISAQLDLLLNEIKNTNDVFDREIIGEVDSEEFKDEYYKTIIKTQAQVNECVEVFKICNFNNPDYAKCVIMSNLIGLNILHKEIREKGGAYGSGASPSDSGLCVFYSYRDPNPVNTYNVFEKALIRISEGEFTDDDIKDAKIFTFSNVDKIVNPANKGLEFFLRNLTENERNSFRNRLIDVTRDDVIEVCKKYFIPQLEDGKTSRVIFGSVYSNNESSWFDQSEWDIVNSLDFLSDDYFKQNDEDEIDKKN